MKNTLKKIVGLFALALMLITLAGRANAQEVEWQTYTNEAYQFSIDHLSDWALEEGWFGPRLAVSPPFIVFTDPLNPDTVLGVAPRGGDEEDINLVKSLPLIESEELLIDGRKASQDVFDLSELEEDFGPGAKATLMTFKEYPVSWTQDNYILFLGTNAAEVGIMNEMIKSLDFLDEMDE